ncbi:MAG: tyrosine--tRNA ligase [Alphaproteobacteria bacterium]|nr:tyrosine--tRNA ligase [Alphaproteobacteria bacterium]
MLMVGYNFSSPILKDLDERGFVYQVTDPEALDKLFLSGDSVTLYVGFDPTAQSLHVGHLLWIRLIKKLQQLGIHAIVICGGATSKIGDPTWKDKERVMLDYSTVLSNIKFITTKLQSIIKFDDAQNPVHMLNNDEWMSKINYMEFLRDFGSLFSVNKMLTMDSVSARLNRQQHLSFLEFNYMILQAYDFLYLFENYDCQIQVGGADQWSNMISGVDLIRRKTGKIGIGMSMPLLTNADGKKMGKTEAGAIWLDEHLVSPFDFWQYWRNVDDRDVTKLLKLFTDIDVAEIESYNALIGTTAMNDKKIVLADALTNMVHPQVNLNDIHNTAFGLFANNGNSITDLKAHKIPVDTRIDKVLVMVGLAPSQTAARRLIDGKGVKIDGICVKSYETPITAECMISVGKKKFAKVVI